MSDLKNIIFQDGYQNPETMSLRLRDKSRSHEPWIDSLRAGDKVLTAYQVNPSIENDCSPKEATFEYSQPDNTCASGLLVKLREFDRMMDSGWISQISNQ